MDRPFVVCFTKMAVTGCVVLCCTGSHHMLQQMDDSDLVTRSITSLDKRVETIENLLLEMNEIVRAQSEFIMFQSKVMNQFLPAGAGFTFAPDSDRAAPDLRRANSSAGGGGGGGGSSDGSPVPPDVNGDSMLLPGQANDSKPVRRWMSTTAPNGTNSSPVSFAPTGTGSDGVTLNTRLSPAFGTPAVGAASGHHQPLTVLVETPTPRVTPASTNIKLLREEIKSSKPDSKIA